MSRKKKKNKDTASTAEPLGSFIPAHDEPNIKPSKAKQNKNKGKKQASKNKKKSNQKNSKSSAKKAKKSKAKKKATKNTKKAKTETKAKSPKTKTKKKTKKSSTNKDNKRKRAKTTVNKKSNNKKKKQSNANNIQLNDISYTPPANKSKSKTPQKVKKFPWDNWQIDRYEKTNQHTHTDNKTQEEDTYGKHRQRRSSLGSVRELYMTRAKKARIKADVQPIKLNSGKKGGGHRSGKKKSKKHKKHAHTPRVHAHKNEWNKDDENVDIYDPSAMKKKRRKEKQKQEFKVVPKHHVKRSSLPTYNSIRKNNPKLQFFVRKETQRNLATLLDQPEKRKKSKQLKNLSRNGFALHVNKRYRLEDGRIGVCKYKGRTEFGKSSEDWIGLVIQIGDGEHDGTVQGKTYFRCRMGKGLFVRPYDIIQDMGSQNKMLSKQDIKLAKAHIKRYKKMNMGTTTSKDVVETDKEGNAIFDHGDAMMQEKFYNSKTLLDKNKGKKAAKKKHHTQI